MLLKLISQGESDEGNGLRKLPGKKPIGKLSTLFETTYCENRPRNLAGCPWKSPATPTLIRTSLWDTPSTTGGLLWEGLLERCFGNSLFAKIKETHPKDCRGAAWDNPPPTGYVLSGETITHIARPKLRKKKA